MHPPKKIVREIGIYANEWSQLRVGAKERLQKASIHMQEYGPVIKYLEKAMIRMDAIKGTEIRSLLIQFHELKSLVEKIEIFYKEKAEIFFINFRLIEVI